MTRAIEIARELIRRPSITPVDAGALDYVRDLLAAAGFATHRMRFSAPDADEVENLYARLGDRPPVLLFAGHTDVVPPGDLGAWRFDPFSGEMVDGMIQGRGAVDMKGGLAACLAAALAFAAEGEPRGSIAFLVTGDEEGAGVNGTKRLLEWAQARGERFEACLLAEPTNPEALGEMIKIGRRGSLSGRLLVQGEQGHVGYPRLADNPIPHLLRILGALLAPPLDAGGDHFEPSNLEVTSVDVGNPVVNLIPAQARAAFNIRFNDHWTSRTLAQEIAARTARAAGAARYDLQFAPCNAESFLTEPGPFLDILRAAIVAETGRAPQLSTSGGTSDARFIKDYCPVLEFGLVGRTMHAVNECASAADVAALERIVLRVLRCFFA